MQKSRLIFRPFRKHFEMDSLKHLLTSCRDPAEAVDPKVIEKVNTAFPGAVPNKELVSKIQSALSKHGYKPATTLVATSLCCDEVNRDLEHELKAAYKYDHFYMGGLAGFPFGGATSFGAMAHHIPNGGSCLIVYGPHVGIDADGTVGKVNRRGRTASGACCGSAADAHGFVKKVMAKEEKEPPIPDSPFDAQQTFVRKALIPQGDRLAKATDASVELPLALFDVQDELMGKIVSKMCGEVHDPGLIALVGGIQINTPAGSPDYFLPKKFVLMSNKDVLVEDLSSTLS